MNEQIKQIENLISQTKQSLKSWASQISTYHKTLKSLSQRLEAIKQQTNMNENKNENKLNKGEPK